MKLEFHQAAEAEPDIRVLPFHRFPMSLIYSQRSDVLQIGFQSEQQNFNNTNKAGPRLTRGS